MPAGLAAACRAGRTQAACSTGSNTKPRSYPPGAARCLSRPGAAAHLPARRLAAPGRDAGCRAARQSGALVGRTGPAHPCPGPRQPRRRPRLLSGLLHRFAVPLVLAGDHAPLRRALSRVARRPRASDPWLALTSALTQPRPATCRRPQADLREARSTGRARPPRSSPYCAQRPSNWPPPFGRRVPRRQCTAAAMSANCRPNRSWRRSRGWAGAPRCSGTTTGPRRAPISRSL